MTSSDATSLGAIPADLAAAYPQAVSGLESYAHLLATDGVERGLIGPREVPRIWDRHIANCAVLEQVISAGAHVADVGSGAGLPGLVLALVRPDLRLTLIEPLLRRATFLNEAVETLGLADSVTVIRGRAEELRMGETHSRQTRQGDIRPGLPADVVTARAVTNLGQLLTWCWPLVRPGGRLAVLKGATAQAEVLEAGTALAARGMSTTDVRVVSLIHAGTSATAVVIDRPNRQG